MPMPLEVLVLSKEGESELHYIPISLMRGEKQNPYDIDWIVHKDWAWSSLNYNLKIDLPKDQIKAIIIDPSNLMADIDKNNNYYDPAEQKD